MCFLCLVKVLDYREHMIMASAEKHIHYSKQPHILVVDDDVRICELVCRYLFDHGFVAMSVGGPQEARELMRITAIDILVVDVMMPGESGVEFVHGLRRKGYYMPVLMLSALGEIQHKQDGFDAGVDDYLPKPFEPAELVMRLRALSRRLDLSEYVEKGTRYIIGDFVFDTDQKQLFNAVGEFVALTDTETALLLLLSSKHDQVISRDILMEQCHIGSARAVDVQIARLRQKIDVESGDSKGVLQTVRGKGYVLRHCHIEQEQDLS